MNNHMDNSSNQPANEIHMGDILRTLWEGKRLLISIVAIFTISSVIYSLYLPNIYKSQAILSPVGEQNSMDSALRSYGGIASLAGINLPTESNSSNAVKALEKLSSLSFFTDNILPYIYLPNLMAMESWDPITKKIKYDINIFDETTQMWVRDYSSIQSQIPSAQESFDVFLQDHLSVSQDQETGFVTISIKHQSPYVAQSWTELIVKELNNFYRVKDKAEAQAAVDYLNTQIAQTNFTETKIVIAELLQKKTQQLTLIEVSDFYVFDYIDPPAVMEKKTEPKRAIIFIICSFIGLISAIFIVLARKYFLK